jgi:Na+-transporting NADH:ubiquinone oxidoreductase subunit NqrC
VKSTLKFCITWIIGVIIAVFTMSLWRNEEVDWQLLVSVIVVCLIGVLIVSGIMMYIKKAKDKANE